MNWIDDDSSFDLVTAPGLLSYHDKLGKCDGENGPFWLSNVLANECRERQSGFFHGLDSVPVLPSGMEMLDRDSGFEDEDASGPGGYDGEAEGETDQPPNFGLLYTAGELESRVTFGLDPTLVSPENIDIDNRNFASKVEETPNGDDNEREPNRWLLVPRACVSKDPEPGFPSGLDSDTQTTRQRKHACEYPGCEDGFESATDLGGAYA